MLPPCLASALRGAGLTSSSSATLRCSHADSYRCHALPPQEIMFIETSAKDGFNIKLLFRRLATALPTLESSAGQATEQQTTVVNLTAPPPSNSAGSGTGGDAATSSSYLSSCCG